MRRILPTLVAVWVASALVGCALLQPMNADDDARRAAKVTLTAYEATQQAMLIYGRLPGCDKEAGVVRFCKDPDAWKKIKAADRVATTAINAATPVLNGSEVDAGQLVKALIAIEQVKEALKGAQSNMRATK
jgi:hypothetical protein